MRYLEAIADTHFAMSIDFGDAWDGSGMDKPHFPNAIDLFEIYADVGPTSM